MIQLDSSFSTTEAAQMGGYEAPPAGGYIFQVIDVSDKPSSGGEDMLTLSLDIAEGEHQGAFGKFPKKVFQKIHGTSLPYFKAMLNAFKASNSEDRMRGVVNQVLQFDSSRLKGALIGGCLGEAEYVAKDNTVKVGLEIRWVCPVSEVPEIKAPPLKKLAVRPQNPAANSRSAPSASSRQAPAPEDDLPF